MSTTVSTLDGTVTSTPIAVDGYITRIESQNIKHQLIGGGIAVTLVAPNPRAGRLELVYNNEADAAAALAMHMQETLFTVTRDDTELIDMTYVIDGDVELSIDDTRTMWRVSVGYQEVSP